MVSCLLKMTELQRLDSKVKELEDKVETLYRIVASMPDMKQVEKMLKESKA